MAHKAKEGTPTVGAVKLKKWRLKAGKSQAEVSRQVNVSPAAWCHWESFKKKPDLQNATAVEKLTGGLVTIADWLKELPQTEKAVA
jgi:transcriptional regulator with XRE-family HTH domain